MEECAQPPDLVFVRAADNERGVLVDTVQVNSGGKVRGLLFHTYSFALVPAVVVFTEFFMLHGDCLKY